MRILIMCHSYPSSKQKASYSFVHSRAKIYLKFGNPVRIFVPSRSFAEYRFEGVDVSRGSYSYLKGILVRDFDPDVIAVHSPTMSMSRNLLKLADERPTITWVHGMGFLFSLFHHYYCPWELEKKIRSLLLDPAKLAINGQFIRRSSAVVYVSAWMKKMSEFYTLTSHPHSFIIPNPVDTDIFKPARRSFELMNKGFSARSLGWKYGVDIAIRAYSNLRETSLTILGTGLLRSYLRSLAEECQSNVYFLDKSVRHDNMPKMLARFGYFVAPSRTEAQGVAMCEAMACGLPAIATNVGGIPEFVKDEIDGLLVMPENPLQLRKAAKRLVSDSSLYERLSGNSTRSIEEKASHRKVYNREKAVFEMCQ